MSDAEQGASHPTRALLLGFKDSHLAKDILEFKDAMQNKRGWQTSLYWIDGPNAAAALLRLQGIVKAFVANIEH
jgi:hypothetical protein